MIIRAFEPADLLVLQDIRQAAFRPIFQSFRDMVGDAIYKIALSGLDAEQAQLLAGLCKSGSAHQVFVAAVDGRVAGFVSFSLDREKRVGEIGLNAVHPDHAGRGIGTTLYEFAMARMKAEGMALAAVSTGGDPGHAPARRAYEKAGFGPAIPSLFLCKLL